jgi:hypothetical protein
MTPKEQLKTGACTYEAIRKELVDRGERNTSDGATGLFGPNDAQEGL